MAQSEIKENLLPKRSRIKYKPEQIEVLERAFEQNHYPDTLQQEQLGLELEITLDRISIWFQNRRSKFKRQRQADHMTWMRKQIFQNKDDENGENLLGTPKLPALASACHVLSPIEQRVPRDDNMTDTLSGSPGSYMWNSVTTESTRPQPYNNYRLQQQATSLQYGHYNTHLSHASPCLSTPTRPTPDYTSTSPAMIQQTHVPFYDMFQIFSPTPSPFCVPSMHSIAAQSHVTRSRLDETEQKTRTISPHKSNVNTYVKNENILSFHSSEKNNQSEQKFGWLDSDSDSSPTKDKTLECLAQWC